MASTVRARSSSQDLQGLQAGNRGNGIAAQGAHLQGKAGEDIIYGVEGGVHLFGGADNDWIYAGNSFGQDLRGDDGDDQLFGGDGDDGLSGGLGRDILAGGNGSDTFYYHIEDSPAGLDLRDLITDFSVDDDIINLIAIDPTPLGLGGAVAFVLVDDFTNSDGQLRVVFEGGNTVVEADTTGDGIANFQIELIGLHDLTEASFVL